MQSIVAKKKASISSTLIGGVTTVLSIISACVIIAMVIVIVTGKNNKDSGTLPINTIQVINGTAMLTRVIPNPSLSTKALSASRLIRQNRSRRGLLQQVKVITTTPIPSVYDSLESTLHMTLNAYNEKVSHDNQQIQPRLIFVDSVETFRTSEVEILGVSFRVAYFVYCDFNTCKSSRNEFLRKNVFKNSIKFFNSTEVFDYSTIAVELLNVEKMLTPVQYAQEFYEFGESINDQLEVITIPEIWTMADCECNKIPTLIEMTVFVQQGLTYALYTDKFNNVDKTKLPVYVQATNPTSTPDGGAPTCTFSFDLQAVFRTVPADYTTLYDVIYRCKPEDYNPCTPPPATPAPSTHKPNGKIGMAQILSLIESVKLEYEIKDVMTSKSCATTPLPPPST